MRKLLSRRRYEALALLLFVIFAVLHGATTRPVMGLTQEGGALHRFVQTFEGRISTVFFSWRGEKPAHPDVVVLEIDERGAQRFGLWPWPRTVLAQAITNLLDADAKVIGLDIDFIDPAPQNPRDAAWLEALNAEAALPDLLKALRDELEARVKHGPDEALEAAFKKGGARIVQGVIPYRKSELGSFPEAQRAAYARDAAATVLTSAPGRVKGSSMPLTDVDAWDQYYGVQTPLKRFADSGTGFGHFGTETDLDSTIRRSPLLIRLTEPPGLYPSLALQTAARQLGSVVVPVVDQKELLAIELRGPKTVSIPIENESPFMLINYPGPASAFQRLSIVEAYDNTFDKQRVAGKALLAGVTITGSMGDQRVTPFSEFSPGIYTHAAVLSNILTGDFLTRPGGGVWTELSLMLVLGLAIALVTARLRSFAWKLVILGALVVGYLAALYVFFTHGVKLNVVVPTLYLVVTAFGCVFLGYLSVDREKLKMRGTFSRYLGEDVMDAALADPERLNRGEKREMTVLFSDIRGFTSLSEHMSPEKLAEFINQYLSPMTQIVFDEKGTLDKYIGDAVMAFWNAPLDVPDHALRACRAAVTMLQRLEELKAGWRKAGYPELEIGIGINTGPMVVGNMGSDVRVDYTVLGDSVNLGSRLEGTNKEYDTRIIISEATYLAARDGVVARRLGAVRVKGKKVPVRIYELRGIGTPSEADARAIAAFEAGLEALVGRDFDAARSHFETVLQRWPHDAPARDYLAEIEGFRENPPPPDWDGVVTMKTK